MNIMDKTPAKITLHIDGMTWEQVREMIEERYGALMWDHESTAYPTDSVVVRMAFAEPAGNVAQRAIGKPAPQQEAQEPVAWYVTGCGRLLDEYEAEAEARRIGGTAKAMPLYTVPQPSPASQGDALSQAARDVLAERQRQISAEGWTPEHDDEHVNDEIAAMACYYVMPQGAREWSGPDGYGDTLGDAIRPDGWDAKDCDRRRELVKGTALALAELERMDRADAARAAQEGKSRGN